MRNRHLAAWLFSFIPMIIVFVVLPMLPDIIPVHYDLSGTADRYGSKYEVLTLPAISILMGFVWLLTGKPVLNDKEKGKQNAKALFWTDIMTSLVFMVITVCFLYMSYIQAENLVSDGFDFLKVMAVCFSLVWIVLSSLLPKCKQNWIFGIRIPWTLKSEITWEKTHRLAGKLFLIAGLISTLLCLFVFNGNVGLMFSLGIFIVLTIPIGIYSYHIYKHEGQSNKGSEQ